MSHFGIESSKYNEDEMFLGALIYVLAMTVHLAINQGMSQNKPSYE